MKIIVPLLAIAHAAIAQSYDEHSIRSFVIPVSDWNLIDSRYRYDVSSTTPPFLKDRIVGLKAVEFSDQNPPEVFNLTRPRRREQ